MLRRGRLVDDSHVFILPPQPRPVVERDLDLPPAAPAGQDALATVPVRDCGLRARRKERQVARDHRGGRKAHVRFRLPHITVAGEEDAATHDQIARQRDAPVVRLLRPQEVRRRPSPASPGGPPSSVSCVPRRSAVVRPAPASAHRAIRSCALSPERRAASIRSWPVAKFLTKAYTVPDNYQSPAVSCACRRAGYSNPA
jgi:hypothetical protein